MLTPARILLTLAVILLCAPGVAGATIWEQPWPGAGPSWGGVTTSPGDYAQTPALAVIKGAPYVAWYQADGVHQEIRVARLEGTSWQQPWAGADGGITSQGAIVKDPALTAVRGVPYVAWAQYDWPDANWEIHVARLEDGRWQEPWNGVGPHSGGINQSTIAPAPDPALASVKGVPYVAWTEFDPADSYWKIRIARLNRGRWEQPWAGSTASTPGSQGDQLGSSPQMLNVKGTPYLAWVDGDEVQHNSEVRVARLQNGVWEQLSADASATWGGVNRDPRHPADNPRLTAVGRVPYVSWAEWDGIMDWELHVARLDSGVWEEPFGDPVDQAADPAADPAPLVVVKGAVHLAWNELFGSDWQLRVSRLDHDQWQQPWPAVPSTNGVARFPALAAVKNVLYLAWIDGGDLRIARTAADSQPGSPVSVPTTVVEDAGPASPPEPAADGVAATPSGLPCEGRRGRGHCLDRKTKPAANGCYICLSGR